MLTAECGDRNFARQDLDHESGWNSLPAATHKQSRRSLGQCIWSIKILFAAVRTQHSRNC